MTALLSNHTCPLKKKQRILNSDFCYNAILKHHCHMVRKICSTCKCLTRDARNTDLQPYRLNYPAVCTSSPLKNEQLRTVKYWNSSPNISGLQSIVNWTLSYIQSQPPLGDKCHRVRKMCILTETRTRDTRYTVPRL
jgi:hypothetical protein